MLLSYFLTFGRYSPEGIHTLTKTTAMSTDHQSMQSVAGKLSRINTALKFWYKLTVAGQCPVRGVKQEQCM